MSKIADVAVLFVGLVSIGLSQVAIADSCAVFHEECTYTCAEYYPNGVDCRKTKKTCYKVCDDSDVKKSGDSAEHQRFKKSDNATSANIKDAVQHGNVSSPGPTGGSCSATSDDGKRSCSISCPSGKSAECSNTKTSANCRCGL